MKNIKNSTYLLPLTLLLVLFASSCTVHKGQIVSLDYGQPSSIQNQAFGKAAATYIVGFGGNKTRTLLKQAKDSLIANRPLKEGESYVNINFNEAITNYLFYVKHEFIITADVDSPIKDVASTTAMNTQPKFSELFSIGDSVFSKKNRFIGKVISGTENKLKVDVKNVNGRTLKVNTNKVYNHTKKYHEYTLGETIKYGGAYPNEGSIIAFGKNHALVREKDQYVYRIKYLNIPIQQVNLE